MGLKLRQQGFNGRREQRRYEDGVWSGSVLFLSPVLPVLNRAAPVALAIRGPVRRRVGKAAALQELHPRHGFQPTMHCGQAPQGQDHQRNVSGELAHGPLEYTSEQDVQPITWKSRKNPVAARCAWHASPGPHLQWSIRPRICPAAQTERPPVFPEAVSCLRSKELLLDRHQSPDGLCALVGSRENGLKVLPTFTDIRGRETRSNRPASR